MPSRKKTKKNDENTKAVPKSPWIKINNEGNTITIETYIKFFKDFKFKLYESKIFASNNAVENLENSEKKVCENSEKIWNVWKVFSENLEVLKFS